MKTMITVGTDAGDWAPPKRVELGVTFNAPSGLGITNTEAVSWRLTGHGCIVMAAIAVTDQVTEEQMPPAERARWCYCPMAAGYRHRPTAACPGSAIHPRRQASSSGGARKETSVQISRWARVDLNMGPLAVEDGQELIIAAFAVTIDVGLPRLYINQAQIGGRLRELKR
jgi:hypothetical protein